MAIRIAHLSDLHFGAQFDIDVWNGVANVVADFKPALIIVSGDLVDHPSASHLIAARCALRDLATAAQAELFVVPGNHDLYEFGTIIRQEPSDLYARVFGGGDTSAAEAALKTVLGDTPGFTERYRDQPAARQSLRNRVRRWFRRPPLEAYIRALPAAVAPQRVVRPDNVPVLLALLDSNAPGQPIGFASGMVRNADLIALNDSLNDLKQPYLARIAVIHHHILPIAFTGGRIVGAEPLMVLHNAGTVLRILADHRFDLILHGHKHKPQIARLDLGHDNTDGYSITVAAAGSAALKTPNDPYGNCMNLITVADNGQIVVQSLFYGDVRAPNPNGREGSEVRTFRESIGAVKRRAFVRSVERHKIRCARRDITFAVSENGDLHISQNVTGLRLTGTGGGYNRRPHMAFKPAHGRFLPDESRLSVADLNGGYRLDHPDEDAMPPRYWVVFPRDLGGDAQADYQLSQACANCMAMTRWEADERRRVKAPATGNGSPRWDEEWVGMRISHPVDEIALSVAMPESLSMVEPYVSCTRDPGYPNHVIDECGDVVMLDTGSFVPDPTVQAAEQAQLRYLAASRTWQLRVRNPMVGYAYQIRWQLPGDTPDTTLHAETLQSRSLLLDLGRRIESVQLTDADRRVLKIFQEFGNNLSGSLGWGGAGETCLATLFVYDQTEPGDQTKPGLRPVMSHGSAFPNPLPMEFTIPLGHGIAGAAFQQRRILPWSQAIVFSPFIVPVLEENGQQLGSLRTMLSVPVYHRAFQGTLRPPPWSAVGVVSFGSSSLASKIAGMCGATSSENSRKLMNSVHQMAQFYMRELFQTYDHPG